MRFKNLFLSALLLLSVTISSSLALAGLRCDLLKKLDDPKLNEMFWNEYGVLASQKNLNDRTLAGLLEKHKVSTTETPTVESLPSSSPTRVSYNKRAEKELALLPTKSMKKNYEEFMTVMRDGNGLKELYKQPGKWHLEKLQGHDHLYTVRLNGGYRVLFKLEKNDLTLMEINAANVHNVY